MSLLSCGNDVARHPRTQLAFLTAFSMWAENLCRWSMVTPRSFSEVTVSNSECFHWHCSGGTCFVGSNIRSAEHGIYLEGTSFVSSLPIPEALSAFL